MSNQIRSRGRPPIYAAAAVAIQQQQQPAEQEQQGSVVLVPTTQVLLVFVSLVLILLWIFNPLLSWLNEIYSCLCPLIQLYNQRLYAPTIVEL